MRRRMTLTFLLVSIIATSVMAQTNKGRFSVGSYVNGIKLMGLNLGTNTGFEPNGSRIGGGFGLSLRYGISNRMALGLDGSFGWVRPKKVGDFFAINSSAAKPFRANLIPIILNSYYYVDNNGKLQLFINFGAGITWWDVRTIQGGGFFSPAGSSVNKGIKPTITSGIGTDFFFSQGIAFSTLVRYYGLLGVSNNGFLLAGTANNSIFEFQFGLKKYFGSPAADEEPLFADNELAPIEEELLGNEYFSEDGEPFPGQDDEDYVSSNELYNETFNNEDGSDQPNMDEYLRLKSRLEELQLDIENKETEIHSLEGQITDRRTELAERQGTVQTAGYTSSPNTGIGNAAPLVSNDNIESASFSQAYSRGINALHGRRYQEAVEIFSLLIQNFPSHSLTSSCYYWQGEAAFGLKSYDAAISSFEGVLNFSLSLKKDDALLMIGKSYVQLNNNEEAREYFTRLIEEYPNSQFVEVAQEFLNRL